MSPLFVQVEAPEIHQLLGVVAMGTGQFHRLPLPAPGQRSRSLLSGHIEAGAHSWGCTAGGGERRLVPSGGIPPRLQSLPFRGSI
jgi:hypothetical protein